MLSSFSRSSSDVGSNSAHSSAPSLSLAARRQSSLQSARLPLASAPVLSQSAVVHAQKSGRAYQAARMPRPREDMESYFPDVAALHALGHASGSPHSGTTSRGGLPSRSAGSVTEFDHTPLTTPLWQDLIPAPVAERAARAAQWGRAQWAAGAEYLEQPEGQRALAALRRAMHSTVAVAAGAALGALTGITGYLLRTFCGTVQIAEICKALPYIGGVLHTLIGASGTYGAGALIGVLMAFSSSVFQVGDAGDAATAEQRERAWWNLHGSLAVALSPLFVSGVGATISLLVAAAVGTAFVSWYADESLRRSAPGGFESALMSVSVALGLATVGASLAQTHRAAYALNGAFAWPCVMGAAIVTAQVGKALWELLPRGREQSSVLQRIDARATYFDMPDVADAIRHDSANVLVPLPGTNPDEVLSWASFWHNAVRQRTEHGPQVLWLDGPPKSGKQRTAEALAHMLGVEMSSIDVTAAPQADQENQLRQGLADAADLARKDRRHRMLFLPHFDALVPSHAGAATSSASESAASTSGAVQPRASAENPLRGILLFALENNARISQAPLIIVVSTRSPSGLDEGLNSRLGAMLDIQPIRDWSPLMRRLLHKELKTRAWSNWQTWWPNFEDASAFGSVLDEVVKRAQDEGWVVGDAHEVAETAARGICMAYQLFERRHGKQQAASRFDFASNAQHCLRIAAERRAAGRVHSANVASPGQTDAATNGDAR